jgi:hypothetical protein
MRGSASLIGFDTRRLTDCHDYWIFKRFVRVFIAFTNPDLVNSGSTSGVLMPSLPVRGKREHQDSSNPKYVPDEHVLGRVMLAMQMSKKNVRIVVSVIGLSKIQ